MSRKNSNGVLKTMAVISEKFKGLDINEDEILTIAKEHYFIHIFSDVPDPRIKKKCVYLLPNLLMMIFLAIIEAGKMSFTGMEDFIEARKKKFEEYGLIKDGKCPSHDTIRRILTILDSEALYQCTLDGFYNFLKSLENNLKKQGDYKHIGIDGKEMRGSGRTKETKNPKGNIAMLNIYDSGLMTAVFSEPIDTKESEIPIARGLLKNMDLNDTVATADALHCQKETVAMIDDKKGIYVFAAKDNQPTLVQDAKTQFSNPRRKIYSYERDNRTIEIINLPRHYSLSDDWQGLKSYARMVSTKRKDPCTMYFISNTQDHQLIIDGIENRWAIEDGYHKPKDVIFNEDVCRSTNKNALHNIAILNNLALQLFNIYQMISGKIFRKAKIYFQFNSVECLNTILGVMSSEEIVASLVKELKKEKKSR